MFRIAICDDSATDIRILNDYLKELKEEINMEVFQYENGPALLTEYTSKGFCDLLILDMRMEPMNGIEVARILREFDKDVTIIIVTATVDYAVEGYQVGALRYLVKPVEKQVFKTLIRTQVEKHMKKLSTEFTITSGSGTRKIPTDHIYYLESDLRTIRVYTKDEEFTFTGTMKAMEEHLRPYGFIRIHKSFLVNISHIYNIFKDTVVMDNQNELPMSKHKQKEVNQEFISYMEANL